MVAPPGTADVTVRQKADPAVLLLLAAGVYVSARRRRTEEA
jgi:hypothetical protein